MKSDLDLTVENDVKRVEVPIGQEINLERPLAAFEDTPSDTDHRVIMWLIGVPVIFILIIVIFYLGHL